RAAPSPGAPRSRRSMPLRIGQWKDARRAPASFCLAGPLVSTSELLRWLSCLFGRRVGLAGRDTDEAALVPCFARSAFDRLPQRPAREQGFRVGNAARDDPLCRRPARAARGARRTLLARR